MYIFTFRKSKLCYHMTSPPRYLTWNCPYIQPENIVSLGRRELLVTRSCTQLSPAALSQTHSTTIYPYQEKTRVIIDSIFQVKSLYGYFIIFKNHYDFCIVLQGRVILEELVLSSPLSRMAIFNSALPRGYISQYTPLGKNWMFSVLGNTLVQEGNLERG